MVEIPTQAVDLVDGFEFEHLIADRSYAAQAFYDWIVKNGAEPVIPPHPQAKEDREYDKLASRYLGFLQFVSSLIWLR